MIKNKKIKVALFGFHPHFSVGGVENFKRNIIKALSNECDFVDYVDNNTKINSKINDTLCDVRVISRFSKLSQNYPIKGTNLLKKLDRSDEFDLIILLNPAYFSSKVKHSKKLILRQPMDTSHHEVSGADAIKEWFDHVFLGLWHKEAAMKVAKKVVFFTEKHNHYVDFRAKNNLKSWYIQNPCPDDVFYIENKERHGAVFIGRYDYEHKGFGNIKHLKNKNLFFYGNSDKESDLEKIKNEHINVFGPVQRSNIAETLSKYRVFISFSNREGFQNTLVEAISAGLPCVIFDNLDQSVFFSKCASVVVVKFGDIKSFEKAINFFCDMDNDEWVKYSNISLDFANKNFSIDAFGKKWFNVIKNK